MHLSNSDRKTWFKITFLKKKGKETKALIAKYCCSTRDLANSYTSIFILYNNVIEIGKATDLTLNNFPKIHKIIIPKITLPEVV